MGKLVIQGQNRLEGKLSVHGSKNSVLPILAHCGRQDRA